MIMSQCSSETREKGCQYHWELEFRSLMVKYIVILFSELTALMKFSALEIAGFAI